MKKITSILYTFLYLKYFFQNVRKEKKKDNKSLFRPVF